ncbi:ERCC4 domain-containing protein [Brevibacillus formosus]|uniref:ERCC4 domain-containing protein n=1 Tax=Brevibacillus formosus TaxID=54913 RepID=UPI0018CF8D2B|nr:ERCC4 domain-containing protein [Brevibacillus formosus]MBG9941780.1 nuclease [Brevibacillus formosus]
MPAMLPYSHFTKKELEMLLGSLTIIVDTREQENSHVAHYFDSKGVSYRQEKLDTGDYSVMLPQNVELGIMRDLYFRVAIERKNSVDELAQSIKTERFENELIRSQKLEHFHLVVEEDYSNLITGQYRSQYDPKALLGRLKSFEARYGFTTAFISKKCSANYLYHHLFYQARNRLKG